MLASLFKPKAIVDENTQQWLLDTFAWALENFDIDVFQQQGQVILPNNQFYPGKVSSVNDMANAMFNQTKLHAGMQQWPIELLQAPAQLAASIEQLQLGKVLRGQQAQISVQDGFSPLQLAFNPKQINQPQDFIAAIAQTLATILVISNKVEPPGGKEYLPQAIDLVACFMGFGVIMANTAYQFKGGCGSCNNASLNRQAALTESETVFALALFCVLKNETVAPVKAALKSYLRKDFMHAYKQIKAMIKRTEQPALLAAMS